MTFPPPVPPNNRTNASPQQDNHPDDHNMIADALTGLIAETTTIAGIAAGNSTEIANLDAEFTEHRSRTAGLITDTTGFSIGRQGSQVGFLYTSQVAYQVRHGIATITYNASIERETSPAPDKRFEFTHPSFPRVNGSIGVQGSALCFMGSDPPRQLTAIYANATTTVFRDGGNGFYDPPAAAAGAGNFFLANLSYFTTAADTDSGSS